MIMSRRKQSNPKPLLQKRDDEEAADEQQSLPQEQQQENSSNSLTSTSGNNSPAAANGESESMINSRPPSQNNPADEDPAEPAPPSPAPSTARSSRTPSVASPPPQPPPPATTMDDEPTAIEIKIEPDLLVDEPESPQPSLENCKSPAAAEPPSPLPMLRLNAALASDPAANPDAKDLKNITAANDSQFEQKHSIAEPPSPQQQQQAVIRKPVKAGGEPPGITTIPINVDLPPRIPMFMCGPCGIRFSSASTLEAHQTYYCSHRKDADVDGGGGGNSAASKNAHPHDPNSGEPPAKSAKTGKQYACTQCSYSADKKVSLNRHMRMHQSSPAPSSNASNGGGAAADEVVASQQLQLQFQVQVQAQAAAAAAAAAAAVMQQQQQQQQQQPPPQVDRYCSDCDIRFSSTKTYRAHKQHYCSSRHRDGQSNNSTPKPQQKSGSQSPPDVPKTPPVAPQQPFLALPTNPIIVIPYSLIRSASVIPGLLSSLAPGITNPESACFFFQNGTLQPIAVSLASAAAAAAVGNVGPGQPPGPGGSIQQQQQQLHHQNSQPNSGSSGSRVQTPNVGSENSSSNSGTGEVLKAINKRENVKESSTPLDLSVRRLSPGGRERSLSLSSAISVDQLRMDFDALMEGKENLSVSGDSITPEQIVCAPSLPGSPPLTPSPKRRSNSPRGSGSGGAGSGSRSDRDGSVSISPLTLQQQQQLLMRPLLPADIALRLSAAADPTLNLNLNILPNAQLFSKQSVELALRLSSGVNNVVNVDGGKVGGLVQPQISPLLNSISPGAAAVVNSQQQGGGPPVVMPVAGGPGGGGGGTGTPQIFVKQGDSKCKECNIVFCKYENYLAHKKHYCSARNLDGAGTDGGGNDGNAKVSPPISPRTAASPSNSAAGSNANSGGGAQRPAPVAYQQLICAACGIKFTSLDNLSAHQMYYCPKRVDVQMPTSAPTQKERCSKCKSMHEPGQPCTVAGQGAYKCPICEVISPNSTEARRHMDTHGGVKAFRCTICRYKGNTLRGMRTHIRMHFDKKTNDFNEENYITCILEEDGIEIPPAAAVAAAAAQLMNQAAAVQAQAQAAQQQQQQQQQVDAGNIPGQVHFCELCPYYSTYKINVARHIKLIHGRERPPSNSPLIGEGGESLITNGTAGDQRGQDSGSSTPRPPVSSTPGPVLAATGNSIIKTEPEDDPCRPDEPETDVDVDVVMEEPEVIIKTEAPEPPQVPTANSPMASPPPPSPNHHHQQQQSTIKSKPSSFVAPPPAAAAAALKSSKTPSPPSFVGEINHAGPNYCDTCDITFNYVNTFIAHKKFYCKNTAQDGGGNGGQAQAPASLRAATTGSPNNSVAAAVAVTRATETSV